MGYQDRWIDLLDRRYQLVADAPEEDFLLELDRFLQFIYEDELIKPYTNRIIREVEDWIAYYREKLVEEIAEVNQIRQDFISKYPDQNDSKVPKPVPNEDILPTFYQDPYYKSLSWFDELVEKMNLNGPTLWSRDINPAVSDHTEVNELIKLLEDKLSNMPKDKTHEDIFLKLHYLRMRHNYLRQKFGNTCRVWPPTSLDYLRQVVSKINPVPRYYGTISELKYDEAYSSIEQIIHPPTSPEGCRFHLRRVYERLRADIGSHLAHFELIQRYKTRCMFYDRIRIEGLIKNADRNKEDILTRDLALYLFDNGVSTLYRVRRGVHEYDLIAPSLFVEAKVYKGSNKKYVINGVSQLHAYLNGLEAESAHIREVYYVIFRCGGPLYDWPKKIVMNRWTIYPVNIDLGQSAESGSRQPRTVKIGLDEIYSTLPVADYQEV